MEEEKKGFKIVDRRGAASEEKDPPAGPPSAAERPKAGETQERPPSDPPKETGNRPAPDDVKGKNSPESEPSSIGGPHFLDLVGMLQFGAMANMGMIQSPDGKRSPVNLPAAKDSIDILSILQDKTKGNLTEEETGVLTEGLYHLRMAYLAAMQATPDKGGKVK